jgi:CRP-like cAMP-binding protein
VDEVFGTDTASEDGKEILLGLRGSGDLLGEMGALSNSKVRPATVTAATRCGAL